MFSFLSGLVAWLLRKDELKILIVGLDFAGKTTLLEQIKRAFIPHYRGASMDGLPPTIGMNLARITTQHVDVTFWDVGGAMHSIWDRYYSDADGLMFVVDSSDVGRFEKIRATLAAVLQHESLAAIPVMILANKCDLRGSVDTTTIHDRIVRGTSLVAAVAAGHAAALSQGPAPPGGSAGAPAGGGMLGEAPSTGIQQQARREHRIFRCSALTGDGVKPAVDWLIGAAKQQLYAREQMN